MFDANEEYWRAYATDESQVPEYHLPDPLLLEDGRQLQNAAQWENFQRGRILEKLQREEYGAILPRADSMRFELLGEKTGAFEGSATRKEIRIHNRMADGREHSFDMLLYIPNQRKGKVPAFLGLNFKGNHNCSDEPDVRPSGFKKPYCINEPERGLQVARWSFRQAVQRGYASATVCYHDIHPDATGSTGNSAFKLFFEPEQYDDIQAQYSVIGCWAWGLSRALDCLEAEAAIDAGKVALHGHSRLGKTSLWAGAIDRRFALVISNNSGCGGATLHKRKYGENLSQHFDAHVKWGVPPWFVRKCSEYIFREEEMPFDQHELLALMAPRPLALGTASLDQDADPLGEFIAAKEASKVYRLYGSKGLELTEMPGENQGCIGDLSFHYRSGKHDQTEFDWQQYFNVADKYLKREER